MNTGKIILRRTGEKTPFPYPYQFSTDRPEDIIPDELGNVLALPVSQSERWVFGIACRTDFGIRYPIGITDADHLTQAVYAGCVEYGMRLAKSMPHEFDFVDETGGARQINLARRGRSS